MTKYTLMLTTLLNKNGKTGFTDNTKIGDLYNEEFELGDWITVVLTFEQRNAYISHVRCLGKRWKDVR